MRFSILLISALICIGCANRSGSAGGGAGNDGEAKDPWKLVHSDASAKAPALLWNGQIGVRIGRDGLGERGRTFFAIDEYEASGEEKIIPLPNPLQGSLLLDGKVLEAGQAKGYEQTLDMKTGMLSTSGTWGNTKVRIETAIHPQKRILAQRITAKGDGKFQISRVVPMSDQNLEFSRMQVAAAHREAGQPVSEKTAATIDKVLSTDKDTVIESTFSFGRSGRWPELMAARGTRFRMAPGWDSPPTPANFDEVAAASKAHWAKKWETDIVIDGPVEDQQAVRSFLFYLRSSLSPDAAMSLSPFGLSGGTYFGHVFWDADIWVFPALALIDPEVARAIPSYRLALSDIGRRNFKERGFAINRRRGALPVAPGVGPPRGGGGAPVSTAPPPVAASAYPAAAANALQYPWESSVSGLETVPGASRFQHHISGSVAFSLSQAAALGLANPAEVAEVLDGVRQFFLNRSTRGPNGLEIREVMSPDEHFLGNNDLYTNLLAQWVVNGGTWKGSGTNAPTFYLPRDETSLLSYDGDRFQGYKQAAAVLAIYPLQNPEAEAQAKTMLERFEPGVIKNGPAMTDSIHALIWTRLGDPERGYQTWKRSWKEFASHPLMMFSEKRSRDVTYFTTGAGGCLQTVIYGFLGMRVDDKAQDGAIWERSLADGRVLSAKPRLPKAWKSVRFTGRAADGTLIELLVD